MWYMKSLDNCFYCPLTTVLFPGAPFHSHQNRDSELFSKQKKTSTIFCIIDPYAFWNPRRLAMGNAFGICMRPAYGLRPIVRVSQFATLNDMCLLRYSGAQLTRSYCRLDYGNCVIISSNPYSLSGERGLVLECD